MSIFWYSGQVTVNQPSCLIWLCMVKSQIKTLQWKPIVWFYLHSYSSEWISLHTNVNWVSHITETERLLSACQTIPIWLLLTKGPLFKSSAQTFCVSLEVHTGFGRQPHCKQTLVDKWHNLSELSGRWIQSLDLEGTILM